MMDFNLKVLAISHKNFNWFQMHPLKNLIEKKIHDEGKNKGVTINIQFFHEKGESHQEGEGETTLHENAKNNALKLILKHVNNYENLDKPMVLLLEENFGNEAGKPIFDQTWFDTLRKWSSRIKVIMFHNSTDKAPEQKITNITSEQLFKMYWTDKPSQEDSQLRKALMDEFTNSLINDIEKVFLKKDSSEPLDAEPSEDEDDKRYELNKSESANSERLDEKDLEDTDEIDEKRDRLITHQMKSLIIPSKKFFSKSI